MTNEYLPVLFDLVVFDCQNTMLQKKENIVQVIPSNQSVNCEIFLAIAYPNNIQSFCCVTKKKKKKVCRHCPSIKHTQLCLHTLY